MDSSLIVRVQSSICIRVFNLELAHHRSQSLFLLDIYLSTISIRIFQRREEEKRGSFLHTFPLVAVMQLSGFILFALIVVVVVRQTVYIYIYIFLTISGFVLQPRSCKETVYLCATKYQLHAPSHPLAQHEWSCLFYSK